MLWALTMSSQLKNGFEDVKQDILIQAIRNGLDSANLLLDSKDIQKTYTNHIFKRNKKKKR